MGNPDALFHVVITGNSIAPPARDLLSKKCRLEFSGPYPEAEALARQLAAAQTDALIVRTGRVPGNVLSASPRLKVVAKHGIGVDAIDVEAATRLKIPVLFTASANYESVAEHTLGLMLCLAKDIPRLDNRVRQGFWDKADYRGSELLHKTVGIVGFGRIGRRVRELVSPFRMKVLVFDPLLPPGQDLADASRVEKLDALLSEADIVTLHCPLTDRTRNLMGEKEFGKMKKTAWLINTARGRVVEEEALIRALQEGKIAAAGLDTFAKEPPADLKLLAGAGKVVLTPHVAAATEESYERMGIEAAQNVLTILEGKMPDPAIVANPEVYPSLAQNSNRTPSPRLLPRSGGEGSGEGA